MDFLEDELSGVKYISHLRLKQEKQSRRADQDMALPAKLTMCCASDLHTAEKGR